MFFKLPVTFKVFVNHPHPKTNLRRKHLCQSLFINKVAGLRRATLLKKGLWHMRFPVFRRIRRLLGREMIASLIFGIRPLPFT